MKFIADHQLPRALALHLVQLGADAVHVLDLGLNEASTVQSGQPQQQSKPSSSATMKTSCIWRREVAAALSLYRSESAIVASHN